MKNNKNSKSTFKESTKRLFRYELSKTQTVILLILSFMGIFLLPFKFAEIIFLYLFQFLFINLPRFLSDPGIYLDYLIPDLISVIIVITVHILFLLQSLYVFRRILKSDSNPQEITKRKIISKEDTCSWFGLKISQGQSLSLFLIALAGIFLLMIYYLYISLDPTPRWELLDDLCYIPSYGPNEGITHNLLLGNVPLGIIIVFSLICLYTLFMVRRSTSKKTSKGIIKNRSLWIFIISLIFLILSGARIFCHLALFNPIISKIIMSGYYYPNPLQMLDFIITTIVSILSLIFMIMSFFLKRRKQLDKDPSIKDLSWLGINLTPEKVMILVPLAFIFLIFILGSYLQFLFYRHIHLLFRTPILILLSITPAILILFCYYPIGKLLKEKRFEKIVNAIDKSEEHKISWLNFRLDKLESLTIFSTSLGLLVLYVYQLISWNLRAQMWLKNLFPSELFLLFSLPLITGVICAVLAFLVYTLKKTYNPIKSSK